MPLLMSEWWHSWWCLSLQTARTRRSWIVMIREAASCANLGTYWNSSSELRSVVFSVWPGGFWPTIRLIPERIFEAIPLVAPLPPTPPALAPGAEPPDSAAGPEAVPELAPPRTSPAEEKKHPDESVSIYTEIWICLGAKWWITQIGDIW